MSNKSNNKWYKIAESFADLNFRDTGLAEIEINGKKLCIVYHEGRLSACTQKCPHAGGILADGYVDAMGNLVCPIHSYKFNPQNGRNTSGEGYFLKTFLVEVKEDGVYVCINDSPLF